MYFDESVLPSVGAHDAAGRRDWQFAIGSALLLVAAILGLFAHMFRYEMIPVETAQVGVFKYIVRDRWTGEIEVVLQSADGAIRRGSRYVFEPVPTK